MAGLEIGATSSQCFRLASIRTPISPPKVKWAWGKDSRMGDVRYLLLRFVGTLLTFCLRRHVRMGVASCFKQGGQVPILVALPCIQSLLLVQGFFLIVPTLFGIDYAFSCGLTIL